MITIFHGDHEVKISQEIFKVIQVAQSKGIEIVRLQAKKITLGDLESALGMDALFSTGRAVIIEGLFSLPKSKFKDTLVAWIREHDTPEIKLYLSEKKKLTDTQLRSFPKAKSQLFKLPAVIFTWLENIGVVSPNKSIEVLQQVLEREEEEFVFIMLIRQVRALLAYVSDGVYEGNPYMRSRMVSQASHLTKGRLLALHAQLLDLDEKQKTSRLSMSLAANLDLILALV